MLEFLLLNIRAKIIFLITLVLIHPRRKGNKKQIPQRLIEFLKPILLLLLGLRTPIRNAFIVIEHLLDHCVEKCENGFLLLAQ